MDLTERLRELDGKGYQPSTGALGEEAATEIESLRKDAERYRALRRWHRAYCFGGEPGGMNLHILTTVKPTHLDEAFDAAIAKTPNVKVTGLRGFSRRSG
jgi:hypothetical protein